MMVTQPALTAVMRFAALKLVSSAPQTIRTAAALEAKLIVDPSVAMGSVWDWRSVMTETPPARMVATRYAASSQDGDATAVV